MKELLLNYTGALLVTGLLWSIAIVWKIRPRCANCISLERAAASAAAETLVTRSQLAKAESELKASRQELKDMTERLLAHVGVKDPKPSEKLQAKISEDEAERKRQEELVSRGGGTYGGGAD